MYGTQLQWFDLRAKSNCGFRTTDKKNVKKNANPGR